MASVAACHLLYRSFVNFEKKSSHLETEMWSSNFDRSVFSNKYEVNHFILTTEIFGNFPINIQYNYHAPKIESEYICWIDLSSNIKTIINKWIPR